MQHFIPFSYISISTAFLINFLLLLSDPGTDGVDDPCSPNPCDPGDCSLASSGYECHCPEGYIEQNGACVAGMFVCKQGYMHTVNDIFHCGRIALGPPNISL